MFHLFEFDHIGMRQFLEALHLPQVHRLLPGVVLPLHPLDCHLAKYLSIYLLKLPPSLQCQLVARERRCHRCRHPELATSHIWLKITVDDCDLVELR